MAVAVIQGNRAVPADEITGKWRERITQGRHDRARYEPNWQMARAFAAGKHWLKWSRRERRLVLPKNPRMRERYSVEEIGQYRLTAVGELSHDDTLPQLLFRNDDIESEEFAKQANDALTYALNEEIGIDTLLIDLKFMLVDLGTAAVRCVWDPDAGTVAGHLPVGPDGKPVADETVLAQLEQTGQMPDGSLPRYKTVNEGRIRLEIGAPENLLVPAGVEYQRDFPWEIWMAPVPIQDLVDEYGKVAEGLKEESLSALQMLGARELADQADDEAGQPGKLHDHVLKYICYERPTRKRPRGEMVVLAGSDELRPMGAPGELPYQGPDGTWRSGVTYFHYQRVPGRFWGRGLVEVLKDPQRIIDRRRTQITETIDRAQPIAFVTKGSVDLEGKTGAPLEIVNVEEGKPLPVFHPGTGPGPWMQADVESCRQDMARASGINAVTLGQESERATTYSELALRRETDQIKRMPILKRYQDGVTDVIENVVYDIRSYWGSSKQIALAGDKDGMLQTAVFDATRLPTFYKVHVPKGAAKPLTQGAKLQLIDTVANYSTASQQPLPVQWYYESLKAGDLLPLPDETADDHTEKARVENLKLSRGEPVQVAYYDPPLQHIPEHRSLQIQAELAGRPDVAAAVERHIMEHLMMAQENAGPPPDRGAAGMFPQPTTVPAAPVPPDGPPVLGPAVPS